MARKKSETKQGGSANKRASGDRRLSACSPSGRPLTYDQCVDIYMALDYMQFRMTGLDDKRRSSIRSLRNRFLSERYQSEENAPVLAHADTQPPTP